MALSGDASALLVAFSSAVVTAIVVVGWLSVTGGIKPLSGLSKRQMLPLLINGALGSGFVSLFGILAMTETSASNRALFQSAYPAATALAARLLLGERLDWRSYVLIGTVCSGLLLMNLRASGGISLAGWPFWLLLATLPMIGLADVIAKRALSDQVPEVVAAGRAIGGCLVLALALPWLVSDLDGSLARIWPWLVLSGVCMAAFTVSLYHVFDRTFATVAASLIALAPLLTLVAEMGFLGLSLTIVQWFGFALVLVSVVLLARRT
jgi:drug/metabolite transporter (DMT)-like permease